ncbi:ribonuclease H-like domain-containing protein, partial [Mycena galericulata]
MSKCECCSEATGPARIEETQARERDCDDKQLLKPTCLQAYKPDRVFRYIANVYEADNALRRIRSGKVGFDSEQKIEEPVVVPNAEASDQATAEIVSPVTNSTSYSAAKDAYDNVDWVAAKLCIVQIAVAGCVYIIDVKRMRGFPRELKRIIEDKTIAKVGVGFTNDGRVIWQEVGVNANNFVDVGLMAKYGDPERYREEDGQGLSLERCVKDILGFKLDKSHRTIWQWDQNLDPAHLIYAGLDAQASLEVYWEVVDLVRGKSQSLGRVISDDWYTFDCVEGKAVRIQETIRGERLPWAMNLCPWYKRGKFQGYYISGPQSLKCKIWSPTQARSCKSAADAKDILDGNKINQLNEDRDPGASEIQAGQGLQHRKYGVDGANGAGSDSGVKRHGKNVRTADFAQSQILEQWAALEKRFELGK